MAKARPRRRKKRSKKFKFLIALIVLGAIGGSVYFNMKKEKPPETFATVGVERGKLVDKLAETGSIELVRTVEVKSTIAGEVLQLPVEAGDWVEKGQLMAVIEPDPNQSLQLYQKRSAVERGRINLEEQKKAFTRTQTLHENRMIPEREFEEGQTRLVRVRNDLRLAELELEILETKANLSAAQKQAPAGQLDEVRVLAPIGGIVIHRGVEIGEVVASGLSAFSGGTQLFEIGDPSQMIVRGDIAEVDIAQLEVGQQVEIVVDAYPDTTYHGRVRWIAPVGQKKQGSPIVTFDTEIDILDREPRLRQGMSCDIDIIFSRRDSALFLPVEAVLEIFDDQEDGEEEVKGRRGRFVTYIARPAADSTLTDSTRADSTLADSTALDSAAVAAAPSPSDSAALVAGDSLVVANTAAAATVTGQPDTSGEAAAPTTATADRADTSADSGLLGLAENISGERTADPAASPPSAPEDTTSIADSSVAADSAVARTDSARTSSTTADSTLARSDTAASPADSTVADSTAADTVAVGKPDEPPKFELGDFVEVELEIGLETSTRVEILSGLEADQQVAADPALIRRKQEEQAKAPKKEEKEGLF